MGARLHGRKRKAETGAGLAGRTYKDRLRLAGLAAGRWRRQAARALSWPARTLGVLRAGAAPLELAPQDIRTADPTRAEEIYAGYFAFAGRIVNTQGRSPFDLAPPSREWAETLAGFGWLRHLRAAETSLARANAKALVQDYVATRSRRPQPVDLELQTAARRILSWLSQSPLILDGADAPFYYSFVRALARDAQRLQANLAGATGAPRLLATIALAQYALCAQTSARRKARAAAQLSAEINAQILSDGGHISRNPQALLDALLDLLPLRQSYVGAKALAPQALVSAIDRILPMVRMLRHGDGQLALFNGMGVTAPDRIALALAYDDARGQPITHAPHSGYERLQAGDSAAILDAGAPPPPLFSDAAHAGCLSFEFSCGRDRLIVNCGAPHPARPAVAMAARQTAAHSTLIVDDTSTCHIAPDVGLERIAAGQILQGPKIISCERRDGAGGPYVQAAHDGYGRKFGLVHERRLEMNASGARLSGRDRLLAARPTGVVAPREFALRFHLHPSVAIVGGAGETEVALEAASGRLYLFEAGGATIAVEDSVFFASPEGVRPTYQLVVRGPAQAGAVQQWSLSQASAY